MAAVSPYWSRPQLPAKCVRRRVGKCRKVSGTRLYSMISERGVCCKESTGRAMGGTRGAQRHPFQAFQGLQYRREVAGVLASGNKARSMLLQPDVLSKQLTCGDTRPQFTTCRPFDWVARTKVSEVHITYHLQVSREGVHMSSIHRPCMRWTMMARLGSNS